MAEDHFVLIEGNYVRCLSYTAFNSLVYLELVGPTQLTRAFWATQAKREMGKVGEYYILPYTVHSHYGVKTDTIMLDAGRLYVTFFERLGFNLTRFVMFHPDMTKFSYQYILGGTQVEPSPWFALAIGQLDLPVLPQWLTRLWQQGISENLIYRSKANSWGTAVWYIVQKSDLWQSLLLSMLKEGLIHG